MKKHTIEDANELTLNVRKSFRLLYLYQKRILDTVNYIGDSFGLIYDGGYPKFSNSSPNKGQGKLTNWAWDWLNMYRYSFEFTSGKNVRFSVFLESDTGSHNIEHDDRTDLDRFESVEDSDSLVHLIVWDTSKVTEEFPIRNFLYKKDEATRKEGVVLHDGSLLGKSYSLTSIFDEDGAFSVAVDFSKFCHSNNFSYLSINEKIV